MSDPAAPDKENLIKHFREMCVASEDVAMQYLEANEWSLFSACDRFFADEEGKAEETLAGTHSEGSYTGPRTLDGRPAPQDYQRLPNPAREPKKKGIATLGSLGGSTHQNGDDDDDTDDEADGDGPDDGRGNLFAGGEKSGLAVQDPKQEGGSRGLINDILSKARANSSRPDAVAESGHARSSFFRGTGMTLGGDGVESRAIPDPLGPLRPSNTQPVERVLHIWQDGFSIDDGELRRYDDPANQADLQMIRSGRAPLHLMNVQHDEAVDVKLQQHDTPYSPLPKKYKPFSGSGRRLGSPVPGVSPEIVNTSTSIPESTVPAASSTNPEPAIDDSQPTITIRIHLPDGTRLPVRFNTTHTIGEIYNFVQAASPETRARPWVLATTFPNQEHKNKSLALHSVPEFKKGGSAVVKWA